MAYTFNGQDEKKNEYLLDSEQNCDRASRSKNSPTGMPHNLSVPLGQRYRWRSESGTHPSNVYVDKEGIKPDAEFCGINDVLDVGERDLLERARPVCTSMRSRMKNGRGSNVPRASADRKQLRRSGCS